jgi:hypothetical protein
MKIHSLEKWERCELAAELIRRRLRTFHVKDLLKLPETEIREIHRMVHGSSPSPGGRRSSLYCCRTRLDQQRLSLLVLLYREVGGPTSLLKPIDSRTLINSFDLFQDVCPTPGLDLTDAWLLLSDHLKGDIALTPCKKCGIEYLQFPNAEIPISCPFCELKNRRLSRLSSGEIESNKETDHDVLDKR